MMIILVALSNISLGMPAWNRGLLLKLKSNHKSNLFHKSKYREPPDFERCGIEWRVIMFLFSQGCHACMAMGKVACTKCTATGRVSNKHQFFNYTSPIGLIEFPPYSSSDLGSILASNADWVAFEHLSCVGFLRVLQYPPPSQTLGSLGELVTVNCPFCVGG